MQVGVILEPEPWGLPLNFKLMPEYLNSLGYRSHAVGKWHLGFFKKAYTPIKRGFSTHFGFWNGHQDYYKHTVQASVSSDKKTHYLSKHTVLYSLLFRVKCITTTVNV